MDQSHRARLDGVLRAVLRQELYPLLARINYYLVRWLRKKYKRLRRFRAALAAWKRAAAQRPGYFAQWRWVTWVWQ